MNPREGYHTNAQNRETRSDVNFPFAGRGKNDLGQSFFQVFLRMTGSSRNTSTLQFWGSGHNSLLLPCLKRLRSQEARLRRTSAHAGPNATSAHHRELMVCLKQRPKSQYEMLRIRKGWAEVHLLIHGFTLKYPRLQVWRIYKCTVDMRKDSADRSSTFCTPIFV